MKPAIYSKFQTVAKIRQALADAPAQTPNSTEAFEGKVFELCEEYGGPVATLAELHEFLDFTRVRIACRDGSIIVKRAEDGTWREE